MLLDICSELESSVVCSLEQHQTKDPPGSPGNQGDQYLESRTLVPGQTFCHVKASFRNIDELIYTFKKNT